MSGVKGRSGRKRLPLEEHVRRGTYRADRHGPLPEHLGLAPGRRRPAEGAPPRPPAGSLPSWVLDGLQEAGARLATQTFKEFAPDGADWSTAGLTLLRAAAVAADEAAEARQVLARVGLTRRTRSGREMASPWLAVETRANRALLAMLRHLGVER